MNLIRVGPGNVFYHHSADIYFAQFEEKLNAPFVWALTSDGEFHGYAVTKRQSPTQAELVWIWAPGHGKKLMDLLILSLKNDGFNKMRFNLSLDPSELKVNVLRRLNFYLGMDHVKALDITFRPQYGPLILMEKSI